MRARRSLLASCVALAATSCEPTAPALKFPTPTELRPWPALWVAPLPSAVNAPMYTPVVQDGVVYVVSRGQLGAADAATGQWRWWTNGTSTAGTIGFTSGLVIRGGERLVAVRRSDGQEVWARATPGNVSVADKPTDATAVYTGSHSGWVLAAALTDGRTLWQVRPMQDSLDVLGAALSGDTLYVAGKKRLVPDTLSFFGFGNAVVLALDKRNGAVLARWDDRDARGESNVAWPPLFTDSLIVFGQSTGDGLIALDRRSLRQVWRAPVEAVPSIGVTSRVVALGDTVYGASNAHLIAVQRSTGRVLWRDVRRGGLELTACRGQLASAGPSLNLSAPIREPPVVYLVGEDTRVSNPQIDSDGQRVFAEGRNGLTAYSCGPN